MSTDDSRRRVEYQSVSGALAQLDSKNPRAALLIAGVANAVIAEAERSPRFAKALADSVAALIDQPAGAPAPATSVPRRRAPAKPRVTRAPGAFDPFVVYRESGAGGLSARLTALTVDQLRDIIAEQELDTRKETGRKRKLEVLVTWIIERVEASENKGSVFR
ncbi:hypothetical protein GII30_17820 [Gordonia amarae]|uniref:Uncharacterized protein n=2 Tax=Gordonia amarae TaxID=36821 RepID=G7GNE5_9ACTN|nr:hypothetical protein [Gordonia amarae]MCS3880286.1 hypothetical protein [Gordonia amarae]QHN18635.1 hypothetical protein GII35_18180 [Gordonia amarae]QHN23110.1 hypothetical protein GII34_17680 [Gordonia amarae]QHN32011.1 hypothetical protein GII32_17985 [Gordonia amarae]QHN40758.1 hypothetical protein GII30_17820 [Gordonia amarae]